MKQMRMVIRGLVPALLLLCSCSNGMEAVSEGALSTAQYSEAAAASASCQSEAAASAEMSVRKPTGEIVLDPGEGLNRSFIFDTSLTLPESWNKQDTASGCFYTDPDRRIAVYVDVADEMNQIPMSFTKADTEAMFEACDRHFTDYITVFTHGELGKDTVFEWRETADYTRRGTVSDQTHGSSYPVIMRAKSVKGRYDTRTMAIYIWAYSDADKTQLDRVMAFFDEQH